MSEHLEEFWKWAKTAPLPVVLALTLALSGWVWAIAADQQVEKAKSEGVAKQVDKMDGKLDRLLEAVAELKAEQRAVGAAAVALAVQAAPAPAPTPLRAHTPPASKEK